MHSRTHGKATMKWNRYLSIMALPILSACGVGGEDDGSHPGEVEAIADAYGGEMEDKAARPFDPDGTVTDAVPLQTATAAAAPSAFAQCSVCHSLEPGRNGIGPSLAGVLGRAAGSVPGFSYSPAMRGSGLVWDRATLDRFLADPRAMVPGTTMMQAGLSSETERAAIIDWIEGA